MGDGVHHSVYARPTRETGGPFDPVNWQFTASRSNELWVADLVRHEVLLNRVGREATIAGLSQQCGKAEGSPISGMGVEGGQRPFQRRDVPAPPARNLADPGWVVPRTGPAPS